MRSEDKPLLDIHLAEYTALTTRNTYYMSVSFTIWPAVVLYLTLFGILKGWETHENLLALLAAFGTELLGAGWYFCLYEQYQNVIYMETKLRPKLQALFPKTEFWTYENYRHSRPGNRAKLSDLLAKLSRLTGDFWAGLLIIPPAIYILVNFFPGLGFKPECYVWILSIVALLAIVGLMWGTAKARIALEKALTQTKTHIADTVAAKKNL